MSKEKLPSPTTKDSKVTDKEALKKENLSDYTDEELDAMGFEEESKLWGKALVEGINEASNHGKSN